VGDCFSCFNACLLGKCSNFVVGGRVSHENLVTHYTYLSHRMSSRLWHQSIAHLRMLVVEIEMNRQAGVSNRAMAVLPSVVCVRIYNELTLDSVMLLKSMLFQGNVWSR
jgi:hypothetical protein